jgi:3-mercaptopyruvate sulfurtransferase SseA
VLELQEAGVTNVKALKGGWAQWLLDKNPTQKGSK